MPSLMPVYRERQRAKDQEEGKRRSGAEPKGGGERGRPEVEMGWMSELLHRCMLLDGPRSADVPGLVYTRSCCRRQLTRAMLEL